MTSNGRRPQMLKVEYLRNHFLDHPQILNLSFGNRTKIENCMKGRQPPLEDELTILKVEYLT